MAGEKTASLREIVQEGSRRRRRVEKVKEEGGERLREKAKRVGWRREWCLRRRKRNEGESRSWDQRRHTAERVGSEESGTRDKISLRRSSGSEDKDDFEEVLENLGLIRFGVLLMGMGLWAMIDE